MVAFDATRSTRTHRPKDVWLQFAQAFEYTSKFSPVGDKSVANLYQKVCASRLDELEEQEVESPDVQDERILLSLEQETWQLVQLLYRLRVTEENDTDMDDLADTPHATDSMLVRDLLKKNARVAESLLVKQWLQERAPPFTPHKPEAGYLKNTIRLINANRDSGIKFITPEASMNIVQNADPDAAVREGRSLAQEDIAFQRGLNKSVYQYIRRGQLNEAMTLCRQCDEAYRCASLRGAVLHWDPILDAQEKMPIDKRTHGNANRTLWKGTCFQIAQDPAFDDYERATYGALSGDLESVLPVCSSWDDRVWVYLNAYVEGHIEEHLQAHGRSTVSLLPIPKFPTNLTIPEIFKRCRASETQNKVDARNIFHRVQELIIIGDTDRIARELLNLVNDSSSNHLIHLHLLRFATHFIDLLVQLNLDPSNDVLYTLLDAYIEQLISRGKLSVVALYTSRLTDEGLITQKYADFLLALEADKQTRYDFIDLAEKRGLDIFNILSDTYFNDTSDALSKEIQSLSRMETLPLFTGRVSEQDQRLIRAIEWLTYSPQQYHDALIQCNRLFRRLLLQGKVDAAKQLMQSLPPAIIQADDTMDGAEPSQPVLEHVQYRSLLDCLLLYATWKDVAIQEPKEDTLAHRVALYAKASEGTKQVRTLTDEATTAMERLLTSDWLKFATDLEEFAQLRMLYVPALVFSLHNMYYTTKDTIPG
ncbi:hypothetical protein BZG36_05342, partial [Bifiguratus adelaidae]